MKKILFLVVGVIIGFFLSLGLIYLSSILIQYFGVQLYSSEMEQQRNFNMFLFFSLSLSLLGGYLAYKKCGRS